MSEHEVMCPHCGYILRDLWDHEWGTREEVETDCGSCEKPIIIRRNVTVDYSAEKKEEKAT